MTGRRRRATGHRGAVHKMLHAAACPDCDSDVTVIQVAPDIYQGIVEHDDSCPWFTAIQRRPRHPIQPAGRTMTAVIVTPSADGRYTVRFRYNPGWHEPSD